MPNTTTPLREISLPDVLGWEWSNTYEGFEGEYRHQISWSKGTRSISYGTKAPGGQWVHTRITDPERFGFDGTAEGSRKAAQAFYLSQEAGDE